MRIKLQVNGVKHEVELEGHERLIDLLREKLGIKSVKDGCGTGECGMCAVLVNGVPMLSCLMLAIQARGKKIITVEGLEENGKLHPLQEAFIKTGAVQCGYCIPGAIIVAKGLIDRRRRPSREEIRRELRSVLCRCGSYLMFEEAIQMVLEGRDER